MPHEQADSHAYFETPARAERLQLLLHLVRNIGEVIYLRAPAGAGKTLFARKLLEILDEDIARVWIRGGQDPDVAVVAADQLGLPAGTATASWPGGLLKGLGEQELLVVVDDADDLDLPAVERLAALHARGGRLLLLGHGGLARTNRDWDLQFVDLPAFDAAETTAFLRGRAGAADDRISDDLAAALHQAAHGMPGPLLDALDEVLARARRHPAGGAGALSAAGRRGPGWQWMAGAVIVVLLLGVLVFQDRINRLFEPRVAQLEAPPQPPPDTLAPTRDEPAAATVPGPSIEPPAAHPAAPAEGPPLPDPATPPDAQDALAGPAPGGESPAAPPADLFEPPATALPDAPAVAADESPPAPDDADTLPAAADGPTAPLAPPPPLSTPGPTPVDAPAPPAGSAPVEERPVPAPPRVEMPPPTRAPAVVPPALIVVPAPPEGGEAWLKAREPRRYTLQLVGARNRAGIDRFIRDHGLGQPYAVFERQLDGRPWYSLVAGDYPDRAAALAARERLPGGVDRKAVWPRTFASIFESR